MKVSIVVPVYNVESYVEECIKSLCNQTLKDLEIIVVDDGSNDNSINLVKKFDDKRIKIISQKNSGLSSARNTGMKIAKGEYIAFVDSDDFIGLESAYEDMYNIAIKENSDIVAGNCIWHYSTNNNTIMDRDMKLFSESPMKAQEFFISSLKSNRIYAPVWLNLYKREFLDRNNLEFKVGIYHEDEEFTPRALIKANLISIYDEEFYIYRQRVGSITNSNKSTKNIQDLFAICDDLEDVSRNIENKELKKLFKRHLASSCLYTIYKNKLLNVDRNVKQIISRNSVTLPLRIKSTLLNINENLYILAQKKIDELYNFIK